MSLTRTLGAIATVVFTVADCAFPAFTLIEPFPIVPVAENVTGVRLPVVALRVLGPAVTPRTQLPTVAMPLALVVCVPPVTTPPPVATANVTVAPSTGLLN